MLEDLMPRLFYEYALREWNNIEQSWLKPFMYSVRQVAWARDYMDDITADFLFIAGKEIDPHSDDFGGMNSRKFWALVRKLPTYEGSVQKRMIREYEDQQKAKKERLAQYALPNGRWNWKALAQKAKADGAQLERG